MNYDWHVYDLQTGLLTGATMNAPEDIARRHVPEGCGIVRGVTEPHAQRVDLATGQLVDHVPEQPTADHVWDGTSKRWRLSAAATARAQTIAAARARVADLEARQPRALREVALGDPGARQRLQAIEDEIAALRPTLRGAP